LISGCYWVWNEAVLTTVGAGWGTMAAGAAVAYTGLVGFFVA